MKIDIEWSEGGSVESTSKDICSQTLREAEAPSELQAWFDRDFPDHHHQPGITYAHLVGTVIRGDWLLWILAHMGGATSDQLVFLSVPAGWLTYPFLPPAGRADLKETLLAIDAMFVNDCLETRELARAAAEKSGWAPAEAAWVAKIADETWSPRAAMVADAAAAEIAWVIGMMAEKISQTTRLQDEGRRYSGAFAEAGVKTANDIRRLMKTECYRNLWGAP